ncbi:hypothetical protein CHUAL_005041 [Chamberlinius hualienensis]
MESLHSGSKSSVSSPTDSSASGSQSSFSEASHLLLNKKKNEKEDRQLLIAEKEQKRSSFPKSVFFIVGNEFCERFSYYGMRTVLILYLTNQLLLSNNDATVVYHAFTMLCYFTPIFGAMLADSLLGKYNTIFYVSILYALGNVVLSLAATPPLHFPMLAISMLGLFLIALGTGGIKPCVSAFGGDQFGADQVRERERFFFIFYFAINAGSLISTYVTPLLRGSVQCFGSDTCFPLAFGVPAIIMVVSIILFVSGKRLYRINPPQGNLAAKVVSCIGRAIKNKFSKTTPPRDNWLDYADDKYDGQFISDVRATLRVMYLFIPLPFFWALFDQQGSTWTLQATQMNGRLSSSYTIQPDQMQVVNPLLILLFIPVFDSAIYPLLTRCGFLTKPLQRMFAGGILAVVAFVIAGFLQIKIEATLPSIPEVGHVEMTFMNAVPCDISLNMFNPPLNSTIRVGKSENIDISLGSLSSVDISLLPQCSSIQSKNFTLNVRSLTSYGIFLTNVNSEVELVASEQVKSKPKDGKGSFRIAYNLASMSDVTNFELISDSTIYTFPVKYNINFTEYESISSMEYELRMVLNSTETGTSNHSLGKVTIESGGVYTLALKIDSTHKNASIFMMNTEVSPNSVHMLWEVPQYVIMTAGEIMFSITGLEFSYSQAPASMKSVLTAAWLLTTAFGNLIVIIIEEIPSRSSQSTMFFIYAVALFIVMALFALMCRSYEYVTPISKEADRTSKDPETEIKVIANGENYSSI